MAGVLGALAPDVDAVLMPFGWDVYLRAHEIGTHSLAGSLPIAGSAALIVRAFARDTPVFDLFAAAWLGCLSHVALDVLSGARIQIGWPLVPGRVSLPLVAMGEPWLLAIFVAGAVALAMSRRRPRATAVALVAGVAAFLGVKAVLLAQALPPDRIVDHDPVLTRIVEARWGSLTKWLVFDRRADTVDAVAGRGRTPSDPSARVAHRARLPPGPRLAFARSGAEFSRRARARVRGRSAGCQWRAPGALVRSAILLAASLLPMVRQARIRCSR